MSAGGDAKLFARVSRVEWGFSSTISSRRLSIALECVDFLVQPGLIATRVIFSRICCSCIMLHHSAL